MKPVNRIKQAEENAIKERMEARIVEALRWLDVHAPGRAYAELQQALAQHPGPRRARKVPF